LKKTLKKKNRYTAFYTYLSPFLETGNEALIAQAKKDYRRRYKAEWRKNKRGISKEITTTWDKDEYKTLKVEALYHKESIAGYIKKSVLAYMDKRYVTPNPEQVTKAIQLLALVYNSVSELADENSIPKNIEKKLQEDITNLEHDIRVLLFSPRTIEEIVKEQITSKPSIKSKLITYIENLHP
jgi:hypothetical protein